MGAELTEHLHRSWPFRASDRAAAELVRVGYDAIRFG